MKKRILIISIIVLILSILGITYYEKHKFRPIIIFNENIEVEYASEAYLNSFVISTNVNIIDQQLDTFSLGEKEVTFKYLNNHNKEKSYKVKFKVVDTTIPIIYASSSKTTYKGVDIDLLSGIICADNADSKITCRIEGEYDINEVGTYELKYVAVDESNNMNTKDLTLTVIEEPVSTSSNKEPTPIEYVYIEDVIEQYKDQNVEVGIDISRWQGEEIDFNKVRDSGVEFVIIRLGLQDGYNGDYELDRYYLSNIKNASEAGLKIGLYFYSYANSNEEAIKQANYVINNIGEYKIELPIAFDWENWGTFNELGLNLYEFNSIAYSFMNQIKLRGYSSILYGSKNYLEYIWEPKEYDVWVAQYYDTVTYQGEYKMWQFTDKGQVPGISTTVDIDILYKD